MCYASLSEEEEELKKQAARLEESSADRLLLLSERLNASEGMDHGKNLLPLLTDLYIEYDMENHSAFELKFKKEQETDELPRIICSEAIV